MKDLLEQSRSGAVKELKEDLEGHLHVTDTDTRRDEVVKDIEGLVRPTEPGVPFDLLEQKMSGVEAVLRKARGASTPDQVGYPIRCFRVVEASAVSVEGSEGGVEERSGAQSMEWGQRSLHSEA